MFCQVSFQTKKESQSLCTLVYPTPSVSILVLTHVFSGYKTGSTKSLNFLHWIQCEKILEQKILIYHLKSFAFTSANLFHDIPKSRGGVGGGVLFGKRKKIRIPAYSRIANMVIMVLKKVESRSSVNSNKEYRLQVNGFEKLPNHGLGL